MSHDVSLKSARQSHLIRYNSLNLLPIITLSMIKIGADDIGAVRSDNHDGTVTPVEGIYPLDPDDPLIDKTGIDKLNYDADGQDGKAAMQIAVLGSSRRLEPIYCNFQIIT
jgi:hypothetical protein